MYSFFEFRIETEFLWGYLWFFSNERAGNLANITYEEMEDMCFEAEEIVRRIGGRRIPAGAGRTQERNSLIRKANQLKKIYEDTGTVKPRI